MLANSLQISNILLANETLTRIRNPYRIRPSTTAYAPTKTDIKEKEAFYSRLNAVRERFPRGDIVNVIGYLDARVSSENTLVGHVMGKHDHGNCKGNV